MRQLFHNWWELNIYSLSFIPNESGTSSFIELCRFITLMSGEGSGVKDAIQGAMVGVGAVLAVEGLWMAGSKK